MAATGTGVKIPDEDSDEIQPLGLTPNESSTTEEAEATKKDEEVSEPVEPVPQFAWEKAWQPTPSIANQYREHRKTVKVGPPIMAAFTLSEKSELDTMNQILARSVPTGAPGVIIKNIETKFSEKSGFVSALLYSELSYKQIIQTD